MRTLERYVAIFSGTFICNTTELGKIPDALNYNGGKIINQEHAICSILWNLEEKREVLRFLVQSSDFFTLKKLRISKPWKIWVLTVINASFH